jgi:hypothetical protein
MGSEAQGDGSSGRPKSSALNRTTLAVTAASAIAFVGTLINMVTVGSEEEFNTFESILSGLMVLSWPLNLLLGTTACIWGSRRGDRGTVRAGQIALGYVPLSFVVLVLTIYRNGTG